MTPTNLDCIMRTLKNIILVFGLVFCVIIYLVLDKSENLLFSMRSWIKKLGGAITRLHEN